MHGRVTAHQPTPTLRDSSARSCDEGGGGRRVVLERRRDLLLRLVVTGEPTTNPSSTSMHVKMNERNIPKDPRLNKYETELGILVLPVRLQVLAHGNRLFNEVPKVLWDGWAKSYPQIKGKQRKKKAEPLH